MSQTEIICERRGHAGVVVLDRPAALNALTLNMVRRMAAALDAWEQDPEVSRIVITATGGKAFCAGGDIRLLYEQGRVGDHAAQRTFWREEYTLDVRLKRYPKPIVALIDGIVMGGGVGVSVHIRHRVAGDRYKFAMPETAIGFFPDVGATYFLARLPHRVGSFLAVTGHRVGPGDAVTLGLADAYVPSHRIAELAEALHGSDDVATTIGAFAAAPPSNSIETSPMQAWFAPGSLAEVVARLEEAADAGSAPAADALVKIRRNAPTSMAIALRQMALGIELDFEAAVQTEFRIVSRVCVGHDFYEGVRALIIDKDDTPDWRPAAVEAIKETEIEMYFAPLADGELSFTSRLPETTS